MKKITYNNKQYVLNDPQYPVEETVTDTDMNEIKEVVNFNADETLEENIKIKEQLERTQSALINITTPKSSNINVKDSSDLNAKIDVFGISKQETRSGINLTNYEDWTGIGGNEQITEKDDDKVVCAITSSSYGVCDIERTLKPNTNYTACADFEFNGTFGNQYGLRVNVNGSITSLKTDGLVNFTTDETGKARMQCYVGFPYTGADAILTVSNIRLYEGTYTRENIPDYEQYGASPSPEFPSEIENVTGNIDITVCNKNLFNNTKTISNVTYNSEEDKWIFNLPNRYDHIAQKGTFFKNIKANTNYTLYFNILKNTSSAAILFNLTNTIWNNNNIQISAGQTGVITNNIKTKEDLSSALYDLWFSHSNAITGEFEAQIMICEGSETDNNYVKYQEQLITFPLAEGQKLYDKDYPASDGIHHVRKQIELDGTEDWILHNDTQTDKTMFRLDTIQNLKNRRKCFIYTFYK